MRPNRRHRGFCPHLYPAPRASLAPRPVRGATALCTPLPLGEERVTVKLYPATVPAIVSWVNPAVQK